MMLPRLFNLGVMPVKFASSVEPLLSKTLILSDKIWQASFENEFEVQPILFDNEVNLYSFCLSPLFPWKPHITIILYRHSSCTVYGSTLYALAQFFPPGPSPLFSLVRDKRPIH